MQIVPRENTFTYLISTLWGANEQSSIVLRCVEEFDCKVFVSYLALYLDLGVLRQKFTWANYLSTCYAANDEREELETRNKLASSEEQVCGSDSFVVRL